MKKDIKTIIDVFSIKKNYLTKIFLLIYIGSFLGATYNHAVDLINHGLFPYQKLNQNVSLFLNIYWTILTLFDPLAILLLFINIYSGLILFGIIILSDVIINYVFAISNYGILSWINFGQLCQLSFLIFYCFTVLYIYKKINIMRKNQKTSSVDDVFIGQ